MEPDEQNLALSQGLLGLGAGLLSGSFGHYGAFAPALGSGVQGFNQGYGNALQRQLQLKQLKMQQDLQTAQIGNYNSEVQKRTAEIEAQKQAEANAKGADQYALSKRGMAPVVQSQGLGGDISSPVTVRTPMQNGVAQPDQMRLPDQGVLAPPVSPLQDPTYHEARAEYLLSKGDRKGATEAIETARKLRAEELALSRDSRQKPLEGIPGVTWDADSSGHITYYEDGAPVKAARVQEIKAMIAEKGASKNITNVNAYTPASEEAQRDFMKSTRATYDQLKQAPALINSIEKAKALIPGAKGFMGPGGETLLEATKFLNNRLGMNIDTAGVKNAEELRTRIFFNIMDNLKKMDAQPSQQQQQIMQDALGKLGTDPNALPSVLTAFEDVIRDKVDLHNNEVAGAKKKMVKFPYDPTINLPPKKGGKTIGPMIPQGWTIEEVK